MSNTINHSSNTAHPEFGLHPRNLDGLRDKQLNPASSGLSVQFI